MLKRYDELGGTLGETLITPTRIYVKTLLSLIEQFEIKGISHITGGGFYENIPRMLQKNQGAKVKKDSFDVLPIFELIQKTGDISEHDMFNTFNMGIGIVLAVDSSIAQEVVKAAGQLGEKAYVIGEVVDGANEVELC